MGESWNIRVRRNSLLSSSKKTDLEPNIGSNKTQFSISSQL